MAERLCLQYAKNGGSNLQALILAISEGGSFTFFVSLIVVRKEHLNICSPQCFHFILTDSDSLGFTEAGEGGDP